MQDSISVLYDCGGSDDVRVNIPLPGDQTIKSNKSIGPCPRLNGLDLGVTVDVRSIGGLLFVSPVRGCLSLRFVGGRSGEDRETLARYDVSEDRPLLWTELPSPLVAEASGAGEDSPCDVRMEFTCFDDVEAPVELKLRMALDSTQWRELYGNREGDSPEPAQDQD